MKTKSRYDEHTRTLFSPGIYELYKGGLLLQREFMDFQTHIYELGEMEAMLQEVGFSSIAVYSSFEKELAIDNRPEFFLYVCNR